MRRLRVRWRPDANVAWTRRALSIFDALCWYAATVFSLFATFEHLLWLVPTGVAMLAGLTCQYLFGEATLERARRRGGLR